MTSYHAMLCQMKEVARGDQIAAARWGLAPVRRWRKARKTPDLALRVGDLYEPDMLRGKLSRHFENIQRQAQAHLRELRSQPVRMQSCARHLRQLHAARCG